MQRRAFAFFALLLLAASCGGGETIARTQITLMIEADAALKAQLDAVHVDMRSGPLGSADDDLVMRPSTDFEAPFTWPLVIALVPINDDPARTFSLDIRGEVGATVLARAAVSTHFISGRNLALRVRLQSACSGAAFAMCNAGQTCTAAPSGPSCVSAFVDPAGLPDFAGIDPPSDAGTDAFTPPASTLSGRVYSIDGLAPLANATVALPSGASVQTDADGAFAIDRLDDDTVVELSHPAHAPTIKAIPSASSIYLEMFLKPVDVQASVPATGGDVSGADGALVTFPVRPFKNQDGATETAVANVTLTAPDTKDATQAQAFPSDLPAMDSNGNMGALSVLSVMDITATARGMKLGLDDGNEAQVSFPAKTPSATDSVGLFSFDNQARRWKQEGTATLTRNREGKPVFRARISHLSWWAVGDVIAEHACMHLCATYQGDPAPYARVSVSSLGAPYQGSFYADDTGCVAFDVPLSTQLRYSVTSIDGASAPQVVMSDATAGTSTDISTCQALDTVALSPRSASACPDGFSNCGGACVDTSADATRCGDCSTTCGGGQSCVAGACACLATQALCGGACTDVLSDSAHCGGCTTVCGADQRCSDGTCVTATCNAPNANCDGICVDAADLGPNGQCPSAVAPQCVQPTDCPSDAMCDDTGACVPIAVCTTDDDCPLQYRCDDMRFVCAVPSCGMVDYTYCRGGVGCVNLLTDWTRCGACDAPACSGSDICVDGACTTCAPVDCASVGAECGTLWDGCRSFLDCGTCTGAETCGGGGVPNVCGTAPSLCGDGFVTGTEQCDDSDSTSGNGCTDTCQIEPGYVCPQPGAPCVLIQDVCDGIDDDVDGQEGEDDPMSGTVCGTDTGECQAGVWACLSGALVCQGRVDPTAEACDGLDNDCDGTTDNVAAAMLQTDPNHCGACGNMCVSGMCVASACLP